MKLANYEDIFESKDKQKDLGAYYTQSELSAIMVDKLNLEANPNMIVYDPTSGFCGLLITVLNKKIELGVPKEQAILQVYGSEIDYDVMIYGLKLLEKWYGQSLPQKCLDHFVNVDFLEFNPNVYWDNDGNIIKYNLNEFVFNEDKEITKIKKLINNKKIKTISI